MHFNARVNSKSNQEVLRASLLHIVRSAVLLFGLIVAIFMMFAPAEASAQEIDSYEQSKSAQEYPIPEEFDVAEGDTLICTPVLKGAGGVQCETASGDIVTDVWCFDTENCYYGPYSVSVELVPADGYTAQSLWLHMGVFSANDAITDVDCYSFWVDIQLDWDYACNDIITGEFVNVACDNFGCYDLDGGNSLTVFAQDQNVWCLLDADLSCELAPPVVEAAPSMAFALYFEVYFDGYDVVIDVVDQSGFVLASMYIPIYGMEDFGPSSK